MGNLDAVLAQVKISRDDSNEKEVTIDTIESVNLICLFTYIP